MGPGSGDVEMDCGIAAQVLVERPECRQFLEFRTADVIELHVHLTALLVFGCMVLSRQRGLTWTFIEHPIQSNGCAPRVEACLPRWKLNLAM
jgi:hypothetical protein